MASVALPPYSKPYLSFADQIQLLIQRGLTVRDPVLAARHLERIGYYRLKSYWFPFRQTQAAAGATQAITLETFKPGSDFANAVDLYVFDKKLRLLLLDAIERIEVAVRVDVGHTLGRRDPWAHRSANFLDPKRATKPHHLGGTVHSQWLVRANDAETRAKADWLAEFRAQYSSPLPIWIAVELWEFGSLSKLLEIAHPADRHAIALKYGVPRAELFSSWIKPLAYVRNICAHHGRLWNHPLVIQPALPKPGELPHLTHLRSNLLAQKRVYSAFAVAQHMLNVINPASSWKIRLRALWQQFPAVAGILPQHAGFLQNWGSHKIWQ